MKVFRCDVCKKTRETSYNEPYPKDWFLIKLYKKAQSKGGLGKGYHICGKCKIKVFGNEEIDGDKK